MRQGILPNSRVPLVQKNREANIRTIGVEVDDRREALRVAAAKVRASMAEPFRHMDSDALMAFLRPDDGHA